MMSHTVLTLQEIANAIEGRLIGDGSVRVSRLAHPADVLGPEDLALAMEPKLLPLLREGKAVAAIVAGDEKDSAFIPSRILVARPRVAMAKVTALFSKTVFVEPGIHSTAVIEKGVKIGKNAAIGAFVYIGARAILGDNAVVHPQTYIGEDAVIGSDALIYAGAKIGAETMALYKTHHVNPLGGCLPMLIQIPIFFGLYKALLYSIELRHSPFSGGYRIFQPRIRIT